MSRLSRKKNIVSELNDSSEDFVIPHSSSSNIPSLKAPPSKPLKVSVKERKKTRVSKQKNDDVDPNFELAIALSASLDPDKKKKDILLPGAAHWKVPQKQKKSSSSKTPLELRSSSERDRLLADKVSLILDESSVGKKYPHPLVSMYPVMPKVKCRSSRLVKALDSRQCLWNLSSQKLRATSRFYVPNLISSVKEMDPEVSKDPVSPLSLLSDNLTTLVNQPRGSDVSIVVQGDKRIHAHSVIFFCRFPNILKDIILEGETQMLCWTEVHLSPALIFLSFVYGAQLPECLSTTSELSGLRFLARKYRIQALESCLKTFNEKSLIDDSDEAIESEEEEEETGSATQNLNNLIDALERENCEETRLEEDEVPEEKQELSDIQDFILTQVPAPSEDSTTKADEETPETVNVSVHPPEDSNFILQDEEDLIDLTQDSGDSNVPKPVSPDIFDDLEDPVAVEEGNISRKRKSDIIGSSSKLSKMDSEGLNSDLEDDLFSLPTPSRPDLAASDVEILASDAEGSHHLSLSEPLKTLSPTSSDPEFHTPKSSSQMLTHSLQQEIPQKEKEQPKLLSCSQPPQSSVTPILDYESMLTPALRAELKKFGLKAVPRTKACRLLKFIYEETHKKESAEEEEACQSSSQASLESSFEDDLAEESIHYPLNDEEEESLTSSQKDDPSSELNLSDKVKGFIRSHPTIWRQVLEYEPIWLEDFVSMLRSSQLGVPKVKETQILDIFDNECITFRSRKSLNRRGNNKSPQKKPSNHLGKKVRA